jgi:hypothetical protein
VGTADLARLSVAEIKRSFKAADNAGRSLWRAVRDRLPTGHRVHSAIPAEDQAARDDQ